MGCLASRILNAFGGGSLRVQQLSLLHALPTRKHSPGWHALESLRQRLAAQCEKERAEEERAARAALVSTARGSKCDDWHQAKAASNE